MGSEDMDQGSDCQVKICNLEFCIKNFEKERSLRERRKKKEKRAMINRKEGK